MRVAHQHDDVGERAGRIAAHLVGGEPLVGAPDVDRLQQPGRALHRLAQIVERLIGQPPLRIGQPIEDLQSDEFVARCFEKAVEALDLFVRLALVPARRDDRVGRDRVDLDVRRSLHLDQQTAQARDRRRSCAASSSWRPSRASVRPRARPSDATCERVGIDRVEQSRGEAREVDARSRERSPRDPCRRCADRARRSARRASQRRPRRAGRRRSVARACRSRSCGRAPRAARWTFRLSVTPTASISTKRVLASASGVTSRSFSGRDRARAACPSSARNIAPPLRRAGRSAPRSASRRCRSRSCRR